MTTDRNNGAQRYMRISDIVKEPLEMHMPIRGYEKMPLVSLEEAVEPLIFKLPEIQDYVYVAKQRCKSEPADGLTKDESASIILYSMEWEPHEECLYFSLNSALRAENRQQLKPWFLYLKLILTALSRLPSTCRVVYSGVKMDLSQQYPEGKTFVWWGFSSSVTSIQVLENEHFIGKIDPRTIFIIDCNTGKDISRHSYYQSEQDILLLAARQFKVVGYLQQAPDLHIIQLNEIPSPISLLQLVNIDSTKNKSMSDMDTKNETETILIKTSSEMQNIENASNSAIDDLTIKINDIAKYKTKQDSSSCVEYLHIYEKTSTDDDYQSKHTQRSSDIAEEPKSMLLPIQGYEKQPLVSLEEAVEPLVTIVPDVKRMAYIAKMKCKKPPADNLSIDESASIMLYSMEWAPQEECLYFVLNATLRAENRQNLKPWFLYLKLIFTALARLPSTRLTVYRGIKRDIKDDYPQGVTIIWWGFTSCTSKIHVLQNEQFLGSSGARTLFNIDCNNGKNIQQHSQFTAEDEILLLPARQFQIISRLDQKDGLHIIQMKEIEPPFPLIEPMTLNHLSLPLPINHTCRKCGKEFSVNNNPGGACVHVGKWHATYGDCSFVKCGFKLGVKGSIGSRHWSCCYSLNYEPNTCHQSGPHIPDT